VKDIDAADARARRARQAQEGVAQKLPAVKGKPRLGPCVATPSKFVAIGLNYVDHAKETGSPIPEHPVVFYKTPSCIVGANDNVMMPKDPKASTGKSRSRS
jgi:2-keto-4-pentenoate hydratase/2-oxohepta-3-ene-1,7-dioic acid hydratase in catechol pathway